MHGSDLFAINLGALTVGHTEKCSLLNSHQWVCPFGLGLVADRVEFLGTGIDPMRAQCLL